MGLFLGFLFHSIDLYFYFCCLFPWGQSHRCEIIRSMCCVHRHSVMSDPCDPMDYSLPGVSLHGDSPGKNTEVDCHTLLQGIFPPQGWKPGFSHLRCIFYHLSHEGHPRIVEWVAYPRGASWARNRTRVSCIADGIFTSWATWEVIYYLNAPAAYRQIKVHSITMFFSNYLERSHALSIHVTCCPYDGDALFRFCIDICCRRRQ